MDFTKMKVNMIAWAVGQWPALLTIAFFAPVILLTGGTAQDFGKVIAAAIASATFANWTRTKCDEYEGKVFKMIN